MRRAPSIRTRITLGSAIVAIIVVMISVVVIRLNVAAILHSSDVSLATTDLASFQKDLILNRGEHVDTPGAGVLVLVKAPGGATAVSSLPDEVRAKVEKLAPSNHIFAADEDGSPYVVVARTVDTPDGTWGLWAARSTASSTLVLTRLDTELLVGGLVVLLAFAGASWLLATAALRPVAAMRRRAETLSGTGENERLPVGPAGDEISALASTLNAFLDRVNDSAVREKRMISDAAHELRTPLSALRTQLELAHDHFGDAEALRDEVLGAETSVVRLSALANGLLELSRLEGDPSHSRSTTATELVDEAMRSVDRARTLALAKGVEVGFELDDLDPLSRYSIEPDSFARLLDNLLSNAVTAVGGDGTVELHLGESRRGMSVEVSDDGPGVPPDFLAVAFDRFTRPDESRSARTGGTGLGLALVRAITDRAGGTAELRNTEKGARATVTLPKM